MPFVLLVSHYTNLQNPKYIVCSCGRIIDNSDATHFHQNLSFANCVIDCKACGYLFLCLTNAISKSYTLHTIERDLFHTQYTDIGLCSDKCTEMISIDYAKKFCSERGAKTMLFDGLNNYVFVKASVICFNGISNLKINKNIQSNIEHIQKNNLFTITSTIYHRDLKKSTYDDLEIGDIVLDKDEPVPSF